MTKSYDWKTVLSAWKHMKATLRNDQGGPLIFIIMIKKLVINTETAVTSLQGAIGKIIIMDN